MDVDNKNIGVIGLDGLGRMYLEKILSKVDMPNLKDLIYKARINTDIYCYPPATPSSWPSIMSGVNPGKHGIYDFFKYENGKISLFTALDLGHPRIHEMLGMYGIKNLMINPIPSYPIIPVKNSHILSLSFFTPKPQAYPFELQKYLKEFKTYTVKNLHDFFDNYTKELEYYRSILEDLLAKESYNLLWINLSFPDVFLHIASRENKYEVINRKVLTGERRILLKIDEIIKFVGNNFDNIAIVSDHGFSLYRKIILVNTILYKLGYVVPSEKGLTSVEDILFSRVKPITSSSGNVKFINNKNKLVRYARKHYIRPFAKSLIKLYEALTHKKIRISYPDPDHTRSKAFLLSTTSYGIITRGLNKEELLHLKHRLGEYEGIRGVFLRDEIFYGPHVSKFPQIYILPDFDKGWFIGGMKLYDKIYSEKVLLEHHPLGVFIMKSFNVEVKKIILKNSIVAPLVLSWMNIPISNVTDNIEVLKKFAPYKYLTTFPYVSRWKILKGIMGIRHSIV